MSISLDQNAVGQGKPSNLKISKSFKHFTHWFSWDSCVFEKVFMTYSFKMLVDNLDACNSLNRLSRKLCSCNIGYQGWAGTVYVMSAVIVKYGQITVSRHYRRTSCC